MKEKIYTIPVTDAFSLDCECPMCELEKRLEDEYVEYILGPSLMEPDSREGTNAEGFCRRHFELLYNRQENRLGLGLIIDTHLAEKNGCLEKLWESRAKPAKAGLVSLLLKSIGRIFSKKNKERPDINADLIEYLKKLETSCTICNKLDYTMDRYIDVILYLWFKENDFRKLFNNKKGFCVSHFRALLEGARKYLKKHEEEVFTENLLKMQTENMVRLQKEVNWFTQKFDYRNTDAPWGNSKDALPRSIQKLAGYCRLK